MSPYHHHIPLYSYEHHACRARAHCQTIISSFKLFLGTVCSRRICRRAGNIYIYIYRNFSKFFGRCSSGKCSMTSSQSG